MSYRDNTRRLISLSAHTCLQLVLEKLKEGINFDYVCELTWKCKIRILLKCFWRQHFRENQDQGADFKDKSVAMKRVVQTMKSSETIKKMDLTKNISFIFGLFEFCVNGATRS